MYAVVVEEFGGPRTAQVCEVEDPAPAGGEVLIEVTAAAVNPVDLLTREGVLHGDGLHGKPPLRLGWDVAGVVVAVGSGVRRIRSGDLVIGLSDRLTAPTKTHGQRVVLDEAAVIAVPAPSDPVLLSTLPLAGLTAYQALERSRVRTGDSVLITGAAGNVGSLAVQLAALDGVTVFGAGRPGHRAAIEGLGAEFIDADRLSQRVHDRIPQGVDAVIDAAGIGPDALDAVRRGGCHVSLSVTTRPAPLRGVRSTSLAVRADWRQLTILAALHESGALVLPGSVVTHPLKSAATAYAEATNRRVVLTP